MRNALIIITLCSMIAWPVAAEEQGDAPEPSRIEIAILLDTSGSMDGLINQARTHLWSIVNQLATARKNGQVPDLRVALYEYGKQSEPQANGYIRQIVPLSGDLDLISEKLFELATNGGDEFCGMAIDQAVTQLEWSEGDHFRAIFIAGNEPFTQGPVDFRVACQKAIEAGVVVNTIHCGPEAQGIEGKWREGAELADGQAMNIDQNAQTVQIDAPQDARIAELNTKINSTYLAFGAQGAEALDRQMAQDEMAESAGGRANLAQRAASKSSGFYRNAAWDLVDACKEKDFDLDQVDTKDLPEEMREMTLEEKKTYLDAKGKERQAIQEEIQKLAKERNEYVAAKRREMAESGTDTFDSAVSELLEKQLRERDFDIEK